MLVKWAFISLLVCSVLTLVMFKLNALDIAGLFYGLAFVATAILVVAIPWLFATKVFRWLRRP